MNILKSILELIDFAFQNPLNLLKRVDIGMVDFDLAQRIKEISGLETENFLISLDNYAVLHILNKHSLENEKNHQQIGVEKDDFLKILEVIFSAEKIEYRSKSWRTGKDLLFFSKQISNLYEVVLEVRTKERQKKSVGNYNILYQRKKKLKTWCVTKK